MTHEEIRELLAAYALDAVDAPERAAVEEHLATCPRCRAEVHDHRETAALLAHSGGAAPEGVWQRIADSLDEPPPGLRLAPVDAPVNAPGTPERRRVSRVAIAVTVAAGVLVAVLGIQVRDQSRQIDRLQATRRDPLAAELRAALADPGSEVLELAAADGGLALRGAATPDGVGYVQASPLPRLDPGHTYQLWGAAGDRLISLGVLGARPGIVSFRTGPYSSFAITEEDAPGVVSSTNPPVVAGGAA